jgi:hypothetical protein
LWITGSLREEPKEVYFSRFLTNSLPDASSPKLFRTDDDPKIIGVPNGPLTTANVTAGSGMLLQHNFHDFNGRHTPPAEDSHSDGSELSELSDTAAVVAYSSSRRPGSDGVAGSAPNGDVSDVSPAVMNNSFSATKQSEVRG